MAEFNFSVNGGKSIRLKTAGKYCDRDIVVTAVGGSDAPVSDDFIISWNGDTEGRDVVYFTNTYAYVKVSDEILTAEQMVGATVLFYENEPHYESVTKDDMYLGEGFAAIQFANWVVSPVVAGKAGTDFGGGVSLPSDGTYLFACVIDGNVVGAHTVAIYKCVSNSGGSEVPRAFFFGKGGGNTKLYSMGDGDEGIIIYKLSDMLPTAEDWRSCICVLVFDGNYYALPITDVMEDENTVMAGAEGLMQNNIIGLQTTRVPLFLEGILFEPGIVVVAESSVDPETFAEGDGIYFFFR